MIYIKLDDGHYEQWPDTPLDALEVLGAAMVHCGIYDLDKFYLAYYDPDRSGVVDWDTPVGTLNRCLKQILNDLRYGNADGVAA